MTKRSLESPAEMPFGAPGFFRCEKKIKDRSFLRWIWILVRLLGNMGSVSDIKGRPSFLGRQQWRLGNLVKCDSNDVPLSTECYITH